MKSLIITSSIVAAENAAKSVGVNETTISSILSRYPGVMGGASTPGGHQHGTSKSGY